MKNNFIDQFENYLKIERQFSKNTVIAYLQDIKTLEAFYKKSLMTLTYENATEYVKYLNDNFKETTKLRKIASVRAFYNYLMIELEVIENNVWDQIEVKKREKRLPKYYSKEEVNDFLDNLDKQTKYDLRNQLLFEMLYATGMRISELINIKLIDIKLDDELIKVTGKGNKERFVPLNQTCKDLVDNYITNVRCEFKPKDNYLFLNMHGRKLTRQGINKILNQCSAKQGLKNFSPHKFRHSIATHLLENDVDLKIVQEILGHSDITTTEIYTHVSKQKLKTEYEKYHAYGKENNE